MSLKKVSHVIFDLDGLIIETESIYAKVIQEIVTPFGKVYTRDIKLKILGSSQRRIAEIAIETMELPYTPEQFLEVFRSKVKEEMQHPQLMPGARKLIEHLHKHQIPIAIATASSVELVATKMQDHQDLMQLFHHVVYGSTDSEVKNGKPAPDIFLVCAARFPDKPQPDQCLVLEDAPNGAKGAITAGMQVVLVPYPDTPDEMRKPTTLVLKSLLEFKPEMFGLPAYI